MNEDKDRVSLAQRFDGLLKEFANSDEGLTDEDIIPVLLNIVARLRPVYTLPELHAMFHAAIDNVDEGILSGKFYYQDEHGIVPIFRAEDLEEDTAAREMYDALLNGISDQLPEDWT